MPYPFTFPTTSSFIFSTCIESTSHPSLPLTASTCRGVLRDNLKTHKRLPPQAQSTNVSSILSAAASYLPYLLAIDAGLSNQRVCGEEIDVVLKANPRIEWRPVLLNSPVPGRETPRLKIDNLEHETYFVLSTLAYAYVDLSRAALSPIYSASTAAPTLEHRSSSINVATRNLLIAVSIFKYLTSRAEGLPASNRVPDLETSAFSALASLCLAEATLLAVLKDDPYPAAVAQERNKNDKEWMIKAPEIPKVRAHLFARLCLASSEHAGKACANLKSIVKIDEDLIKYADGVRRVSRARACRFFGIDAELGGQTGVAIAWVQAGKSELGIEIKKDGSKSGLGFGKMKKDWSEKREEKRVESGKGWGGDAGKAEEVRVLEMLEAKWNKMNDTINTQIVPPAGPLLATMPLGREVHTVKAYVLPELDSRTVESMRAPPSPRAQNMETEKDSSDEEQGGSVSRDVVGAFPGTNRDYAGSGSYY